VRFRALFNLYTLTLLPSSFLLYNTVSARSAINFFALYVFKFFMDDLPIIQKTYDLIKWYIPILNKLPRDHKFNLGDKVISGLYQLLERLIVAQYTQEKLTILEPLNPQLTILRYQTRLLLDFCLISDQRYEYASKLINTIGNDLGGWIKQQRQK